MDLKVEECLQPIPLKTLYTVYFGDGTEIPFSGDENIIKPPLEKIEPGSYKKAQQYTVTGYKFFKLAMDKLLGRNFERLFDFVNLRNALLMVKLKPHIRHIRFARKFFRHPHLREAFTFQNIYVGQDPYRAPALFAMIPAAELKEGSLCPAGGMYRITETLISTAEKLGVQFFYGKPAAQIIVNGDKTEGIMLKDGESVKADIVVANADLPYVYRELLPDRRKSSRIDRLKYSCSAITIHWGLDKTYPQLGHHSVFLSSEYRKNLHQIFSGKSVSDNPSFYICAPSRTDASMAPEGGDTLSVIVPCGHMDPRKPQNWDDLRDSSRKAIIDRLIKLGLTDIKDHIKFEICYQPTDWHKAYHLSRGSTFGGLAHNIFQMGYFRPHNRHRRYANLYFAGGNTHPGNGIPLVLLSAKLTTERILKEYPNGHQ
jgi:phytoene desaturase